MKADTMICQVTDMNRAVGFYRDLLGMKSVMVTPGWSMFDLGGIHLGLHPVFSGGSGPGSSGFVLGVCVDDLKALRQKLVEAGRTKGEFHEVPGGTVLEFSDPDGNSLQAIQRGVTPADLA